MMRRFMAIWLILILCLSACSALAEDGLRHDVTGDVSEFVVSDELDRDTAAGTEAQIGTDVYLYVDPYSASYVTFVVVDEKGEPISGAAIYLSYGGTTEFYGTTDSDGRFSTYVFRDVTYGFTVEKNGYRSESGHFTATEETKIIRVVLRKYYRLDIIVLRDGVPVPGLNVRFNGTDRITAEDGSARYWTVSGIYDAEITLPDGTVKSVVISIEGDTVYIVEIGTQDWPEQFPEDILNSGGGLSDMFIVFDKYYAPEDYDLTEQIYTDKELLAQLDPEKYTQEQTDAMLEAYHLENGDFLHIVAEPDKIQHENAPDEIVLDENGEPLYSQRSLILSGWQLRTVEKRGMESVLFENENMGVRFNIADLYSENVARLHWLLENIDEHRSEYSWFETDDFEAADIPYDGLPDVQRWIEPESDEAKELPVFSEADFGNLRLEVRITPALPEEIERAALGLEEKLPADSVSEIVLISDELREKWLSEYLADGFLTDTEYAEIMDVCVHGKAYRVQIFLRMCGINVNVTQLVDSMELYADINKAALEEASEYASRSDISENTPWEDILDEYMITEYGMLHGNYGIRNEGLQMGDRDYATGDAVFISDIMLDDSVPEIEEFLKALEARRVDIYDVDVRHEEYEFKNVTGYRYYPVVVAAENVSITVETDWKAVWRSDLSGMYLIREVGCSCVEDARKAVLEQQ